MSLNDLSIEDVYALLDSLKEKEIGYKNVRKIYQQSFNYFRNNKEKDYQTFRKQTHLLAVKNDIREYKHTEEVYYSDNTTLLLKLLKIFGFLIFLKEMEKSK
ncbi:MAG: hypothetical protein IPH46_05735 [Bacteroidetes bacterium]|nr:hypothetical protein [Bacteroidota bacterium]